MTADDIGDQGELLFCRLVLQKPPGRQRSYFRVVPLGQKHPLFDFLVELVGGEGCFFVQVRSTYQGYRPGRGTKHLRVNLDRELVTRMAASPVPAYVAGMDLQEELGYLLSMSVPRAAGLGGLPARHVINYENLERLWEEVRHFWASRDMVLKRSYFL